MYLWDESKNQVREATPEEAQMYAPHVARALASNMERLTTKNPDGTFTHELATSDPTWPRVIDEK